MTPDILQYLRYSHGDNSTTYSHNIPLYHIMDDLCDAIKKQVARGIEETHQVRVRVFSIDHSSQHTTLSYHG